MMDFEVSKQSKVPLLSRERVTGFVHFQGVTPSRLDVKKALAGKIKTKEEHVVVRHIYQKYGAQRAKVIAHVYQDEAMMKRLEAAGLLKKNGFVVEEPKAAENKEETTA
ncbi:MAG: hypothetical protein AABX98_04665 [Nanoarchaeota archaeon]